MKPTYEQLEARISEATSLLKMFVGYGHYADLLEDFDKDNVVLKANILVDVKMVKAFLSSPTNSEAQDSQRAKDKIVEAARRMCRNTLGHCGFCKLLNDLDSLQSEARGGCEHDYGTYWATSPGSAEGGSKKFPCPFCDKKTGEK